VAQCMYIMIKIPFKQRENKNMFNKVMRVASRTWSI